MQFVLMAGIYSKDWKESIYNEETESTSKNLLTIMDIQVTIILKLLSET